LCLLQELSRGYRIRIEITRTPSIHHIGGPPRLLEIDLLDISRTRRGWNFLTSFRGWDSGAGLQAKSQQDRQGTVATTFLYSSKITECDA